MTSRRLQRNVFVLLLVLSCALRGFAQERKIAVVVNANNGVSTLTTAELRKLFAGEKRSWPGGQPVKLFVRAIGTPEHIALLKLLGMSDAEYKKHWTEQVFRGEAQSEPATLPSNGMQLEAVRSFAGAIALMPIDDVKAGVKVVKVDGHLPGEATYSLE
ncbi:MAG: hypothetical protein HY010_02245 [Acidobacteria bacterium]|nr:hypothetical protein [Acidobacteriota bacterium]